MLVDAYHRDKEYLVAAITRAEYCLIATRACDAIPDSLLATSILQAWMLWMRTPTNDVPINHANLKKALKAEAKRFFSIVFLNDERVWEYAMADISARPS